jgi:hypothetical protein
MNRTIMVCFALAAACLAAHAQIFTSVSVKVVPGTGSADVKMAGISPQGDYVLTTTGSNKGLNRVELSTGRVRKLTSAAGAGFQPVVSDDGRWVICREVRFTEDHSRMTSLMNVSAESGSGIELSAPVREIKAYGFRDNTAYTMDADDNIQVQKGLSRDLADVDAPRIFLEDLQLMLYRDGETVRLSPNGTEAAYIWSSLSPDGKRILYYVSGQGAYVCDLDGKNVVFISHDCRAPKWYDDNTVIGMDDKDDGESLLSSCIVAYTLDGQSQQLTSPETMTMYPHCAQKKNIVACSTNRDEIVVIYLKK